MACQCSSREAPGSRNMWTPAIVLLIGNWWTVASFAQPPVVIFGRLPSSEKRKSGIAPTYFGSWYATLSPGGSCTALRPNPPSPGLDVALSSAAALASVTSPPAPSAAVPRKARLLASMSSSPRLLGAERHGLAPAGLTETAPSRRVPLPFGNHARGAPGGRAALGSALLVSPFR